jgi:hypothetical protein
MQIGHLRAQFLRLSMNISEPPKASELMETCSALVHLCDEISRFSREIEDRTKRIENQLRRQ